MVTGTAREKGEEEIAEGCRLKEQLLWQQGAKDFKAGQKVSECGVKFSFLAVFSPSKE